MKRILLCLSLAFSLSLFGANYTKAQRLNDMHKMASGMEMIQKGFLYRCPDGSCFKKGANKILKVVKTLETQEVKDFLPIHQKYAYKFGEKSAKMIALYANDLKDSVAHKDQADVLEDYNQMLRQCASCHLRLRQ